MAEKLTADPPIFLLLTYLSVATDPATFANPTLAAFTGLAILVGLACFVLPLLGMHRRIAAEPSRSHLARPFRHEVSYNSPLM